MMNETRSIETRLIHGPSLAPRLNGAVVMPIFQSSTYEIDDLVSYHDIKYIRFSTTPNQAQLAGKLANLEGAEAGLVTASGMAAISATLLAVLHPGDHLLTTACLYGGTQSLIHQDLAQIGIRSSTLDGEDPYRWRSLLQPTTKVIYVEAITNPLLEVIDLAAVVDFARQNGLLAIIDNTFATPLNYQACAAGFDLCIHSCSKYIGGHNDCCGGAVLGRAKLVSIIKHRLDHLGGACDPHVCFLLERGLKTLAVRLRAQERTAMMLAEFMEHHPAVARVLYPGLDSHLHHERARRFFAGFSAMISFELVGGADAAETMLTRLTIPIVAPSLGGTESLIIRPAGTIFVDRTAQDRANTGIPDGLVRFSVGLENSADLIADFRNALDALPRRTAPAQNTHENDCASYELHFWG